jgi:5-dehydro-2-deoxygluconokinase
MPAERSGQEYFDFQYGDDFGAHIERFNPDFTKVLVRYNPDDDAQANSTQAEKLKRLSDWLHAHERKFLFELLVPAVESQLAQVGGDSDRYDAELRPQLMRRAIAELQDAGIEVDVWKIEGVEERSDCEMLVAQAGAMASVASCLGVAPMTPRSTTGSPRLQASTASSASRSGARSGGIR